MEPHPQKLTVSELMKRVGASHIVCADNLSIPDEVQGIAYRSNDILPGYIFCCIPGLKSDGHDYAQDALNRGAIALLVCKQLELNANQYLVENPRKAMAELASYFYREPSKQLKLIGITGTNGKTTGATLASWIAQKAGLNCGSIGTLGAYLRGSFIPTDNTTPESVDYQALLHKALEMGCDCVSCEVSSHALSLERVWSTQFELVVFSNLTQDHLDYHRDMEDYFRAKARLFLEYSSKLRIICIDDPWGKRLLNLCKRQGLPCLSVSSDPQTTDQQAADIQLLQLQHHMNGSRLSLATPQGPISFDVPFIGSFNAQNICLAFGVGIGLGLSQALIAEALSQAPQVPGRLERVGQDYDVSVYVDYAHTPDALEKAMQAVRETGCKRLIVVFGCGGDRDNSKRAPMGKIAAQADIAICTSDNPRTENPLAIIDMIKEGLIPVCEARGSQYEIEPDRIKAVFRAIELAQSGDAVLIAGKGHEDYQIIGTVKHHMDDREIASDALVEHGSFLTETKLIRS